VKSSALASSDHQSSQNQLGIVNATIKKVKGKKFLALGYGVNAYFDTLTSFIKLFFILTLVHIPLIWFYASFNGLRQLDGVSRAAVLSIGNLGFSQAVCQTVSYGVEQTVLTCPYGSVIEIYDFGLNPKDPERVTSESHRKKNLGQMCQNVPENPCTKFVDYHKLNATIRQECMGKEFCKVSNFRSFLKFGANVGSPEYSQCTDDDAVFFVQAFCGQSE